MVGSAGNGVNILKPVALAQIFGVAIGGKNDGLTFNGKNRRLLVAEIEAVIRRQTRDISQIISPLKDETVHPGCSHQILKLYRIVICQILTDRKEIIDHVTSPHRNRNVRLSIQRENKKWAGYA